MGPPLKGKGEQPLKQVFLRDQCWPQLAIELRDLGMGQASNFAIFIKGQLFVREVQVSPVVISEAAINRNPAIQFLFYIDYQRRMCHGI